jgi:hypothetical protein
MILWETELWTHCQLHSYLSYLIFQSLDTKAKRNILRWHFPISRFEQHNELNWKCIYSCVELPTDLARGVTLPDIMLGPGSQDFRFPHYTSHNNGLIIWGESHAGHWGIGLAAYVQDQNDKITTGKLTDAVPIHLDTLGIINGQIDFDIHATS